MKSLITLILLVSCSSPTNHMEKPPTVTAEIDACDTEPDKPDTEPPVDARLVGQLAQAMVRIKERRDHGAWFICGGDRLDKNEQLDIGAEIAYRLLVEMRSVGLEVNPWGVVATMYNESGLDPCALGIGPRKWAYREGLLEPRRTGISHTRAEVLRVIESPAAKREFTTTGFDLGLLQVLSRFYDGPIKEMLTIEGGVRIGVLEMQSRAQRHKTKEPWLYWRGSATPWYQNKIRRWMRIMEAK